MTRLALALLLAVSCAAALAACRVPDSPPSQGASPATAPTPPQSTWETR